MAALVLFGAIAVGVVLPITSIMKYTIGPGTTGALILLSGGVLTAGLAWGFYADAEMRGQSGPFAATAIGALFTVPIVGTLYGTGTLRPGLRTLRLIK